MPTLREILIEVGARALCKAHGHSDPDYVPKGRNAKYTYIGGQPAPNWKHHAKDATVVIDAIFDYQKRKAAA